VVREEGWYEDPYGIHEARWFSDGEPTKLVRDGTTESSDPAPAHPPDHPPVSLPPAGSGPSDLLRADAAEAGDPGGDVDEAILDAFAQTTPST
jgi:hypothetical protein